MTATHSAPGWRSLLPPAQWLPGYQARWLKADLVAGITLAAYAVPVSMAYASLAGLPPHHGIYGYLLGGLCYAAFGSSRQLAIGPTSAIALLVGITVAGMAEGDPARWAEIAALTALVVAGLSVLAWLLRLSGLVSFISDTILLGFKAGAALTIGMTQLPKLFGVKGGGEHFFERVWTLTGQLGETNVAVLALGLAALALLLLGEKFLPERPISLLVVALATVVVSVTSLAEAGVATVGALPPGLPAFTLPSLRVRDVDGILPLSCACFLLAYIESVSAARTLAAKHDYEIDPRQELLALGAANLGVAFGQGFPVAGGLSQSAVNDKAGARTPLALLFASLTLAACLLFLTELLSNLPTVVLAAIVLVAVRGLIDLPALRHLWNVSRLEFKVAMVALVGVLLLGILKGVLLAAIASLLMLLAAAARPHVAFLGRIPGTRRFSDLERHPDNEELPGVVIFRVESSLLYFNADHVRQVVWARLQATPQLRLVVCDLSDSPFVDVAGARLLGGLHRDLAKREIQVRVVEAHARVRDLLRAEGLEERVGYLGRHMSVEQAITELQGNGSSSREAGLRPAVLPARTTPPDLGAVPSADEALARLVAGNERFLRGVARYTGLKLETMAELTKGQRPYATILGCSDSRVPPEWIFDAGLGELFIVRVAGNVFSPEIAGSLQYAGAHLQTPLFVVLGHEGCGAVSAALDTKYEGTQHRARIQILVESIIPGLTHVDPLLSPPERLASAVEANVRWTVRQVLNTPEARARLAEGRMKVVGAVYEIASGRVRFLPND